MHIGKFYLSSTEAKGDFFKLVVVTGIWHKAEKFQRGKRKEQEKYERVSVGQNKFRIMKTSVREREWVGIKRAIILKKLSNVTFFF